MRKLNLGISSTRLVAFPILFFATLVSFNRAIEIFQTGGHNWGIGEWLINYNGGFVRRGFFGQLLFSIFDNGQTSLAALLVFQYFLVIYVSSFIFRFFLQDRFSWWGVALALNPAGLLALAWDSNLLVRKEWLGLAILVWLAKKDMSIHSKSRFGILVLLFSASLLSSEVNFSFIVPICYLLWRGRNIPRKVLRIRILKLVSCSVFILVLVTRFHGNSSVSKSVCDLVSENGLSVKENCNGAISALSLSLNDALSHFKSDYPGYLLYFVLLIVACIPIFTSSWLRANLIWAILIFFGVSPLFFVAWDYGRWIFIFIVSITICMATSNETRPTQSWSLLQALVFTCFWGVSHGGNPITNGMISLVGTFARMVIKLF